MDPNVKQSVIDRLKQTNNVLVTVKKNPTVDHLAACIGLTLFLNKQGKHATAVFSGEVPSTIEFLNPENTLEKDTNSLRDFIIALDKSKADKLRYKVEDKVVKIFITPYKTSLSESDLDFSQGDFNVDVVVALGVHQREELDQAIMAHGRILHDATVISINTQKAADLGALNWHDSKASSLSEMTASLVDAMQPNSLDEQIATSFLTGVVAETARFSNEKTTSLTMSLSAKLMAAGANQQLVATKLQEPQATAPAQDKEHPQEKQDGSNGTLEINHPKTDSKDEKEDSELPKPIDDSEEGESIHIDEEGNLRVGLQDEPEDQKEDKKPSRLTLDPPTMGGTLTANSHRQPLEPSTDPLSVQAKNGSSTLNHKSTQLQSSANVKGKDVSPQKPQTLSSLEEQVGSPHVTGGSQKTDNPIDSGADTGGSGSQNGADLSQSTDTEKLEPANAIYVPATGIDDARQAVEQAAQSTLDQKPDPLQSLNAEPLGGDLHPSQQNNQFQVPQDSSSQNQVHQSGIQPPPQNQNKPLNGPSGDQFQANTPPPVPPPMMPPNFGSQNNNQDPPQQQ